MKSLVIGFMLTGWITIQALASPAATRPAALVIGDQFGSAVEIGMRVSMFVMEAVLDLQEAWNSYLEGWHKRHHPPPRPLVPRPDSIPPAFAPALVRAGHTTTAPAEK